MKRRLIYAADAVIILICLIGGYHVYEKPGLQASFGSDGFIVAATDAAFLQSGDRVIEIDGNPVSSTDEIEFLLDAQHVGRSISVAVARSGSVMHGNEVLVRYFSITYIAILIVTVALFIYLALFVVTKRMNDRAAQVFHWSMLSAALIMTTTWGALALPPNGTAHVLRTLFHFAYASAGVLFVHFTLVFPSSSLGRVNRRILAALYAAGIMLACVTTWLFFRAAESMRVREIHLYIIAFNSTRLFLAACVMTGLAAIVRSYRMAREEPERRKLRWIIVGLVAGPVMFAALWIVPQVLQSRGLVSEEYVIFSLLSVPAAFTAAIVKYHIMNIDQLFKRGTAYAIVLTVVLAIYAAIIGVLSFVVGTLTIASSLALSTIAAVAIAVLFQPIRMRAQAFVDKAFFNVHYNYRAAEKEFMDRILLCCDEESVVSTVLETVQRLIPNSATRLDLLSAPDRRHHAALTDRMNISDLPLCRGEEIEPGALFMHTEELQRNEGSAVIAFRIFSDANGLLGSLLLGKKRSGFRYTLEDVDLLHFFCHHAALAFDRIALQRSLMAEQLEKNRLRELSDLKSLFISSVTHELKTPLTSIRMFSELMQTSPALKKEKRCEYLEIIQSESERLSRLIDSVLDSSKIEKGIKEYRFSRVDVNECVNESYRTMRYQLSLSGFECRLRLSRRLPVINADRDAVLELLINLISNSIKFSPHRKKIVISTRVDNHGVILAVEDRGIGIAPEDQAKIFEPFERTDSMLIRRISGAGLGLSLVKHCSDAHRASLNVESVPGKGTKFSVTFPLIPTERIR